MAETIRVQECCYLSTPKHVRSFVGRFIYIYTARVTYALLLNRSYSRAQKRRLRFPLIL